MSPRLKAGGFTPSAINKLTIKAPKIQLKFRFGHTALIKKWLGERSIDFGIALDNEDLSAFETTLLYRGRFNLYYNANQPVSELITKAIFTEPRPEVHTLKKNYRQKYGIELNASMEVSSWETIASLVCSSSSVGFFPDYLLFHPSRTNHLLPCNLNLPEIPYSIFIVISKDIPQSPSSLLLLNMMKQAF
ncbi:MAG: LysR family transcriptional regulator substrate-binding protein [Simkaniaceae bacterium]|nr:LysR family transcriptional regulator substrate-binding protein [Simkaniaceae bacterium]